MSRYRGPIDWDAALERARRRYPSCAEPNWDEWLEDIDLMGRIYRDVLRVGYTPVKRGDRPLPDYEDGVMRLRELGGTEFSMLPFPMAFAELAGNRSLRHLATKTGISHTQIRRLLSGDRQPSGAQMEKIAAAFERAPTYWREYRSGIVVAAVQQRLEEEPETSAMLVANLDFGG